MEQQWMNNYNGLKSEVQNKRKLGLPVSVKEISSFKDNLNALEKTLKVFQESPMEYEMYVLYVNFSLLIIETI
jgi:hypothetical protein